jgi:hypothetical protein
VPPSPPPSPPTTPAEARRPRRRHRFGPWPRNRGFARRLALWILGLVLVVLGIVGLILPVMPGWVFLAPGLVVLAGVSRTTRLALHRVLNRFPLLDRAFLRFRRAHRHPARGPGAPS